MKRIDNEKILDMIYDLADGAGMRIDEFMEQVEKQFGTEEAIPEGIPESLAEEIMQAREDKKRRRAEEKQIEADAEAENDVKKFRELFPGVSAEDIPDEVWEDAAKGISLPYAYALYKVMNDELAGYAESVNRKNSEKGARAYSDGSTEQAFTKEQVEKMSGKDVRKNYKGIINAMKSWRI